QEGVDGFRASLHSSHRTGVSTERKPPHRRRSRVAPVLETIPYGWYSEPETLRREQERIFLTSWQYAGHLGQLPEPGSFFTTTVGFTPIVVTRARDAALRAFLNLCRHRGFLVADGEGCRETLQCAYHAWTYG